MPAIHDAAVADDLDQVKRLVLSGEADINAVSHRGWTPLHLAAGYGSFDMVRWMIEEGGADVAARSNPHGVTALLRAVYRGRTDVVSWMLRKAGADVTDINKNGHSTWNRFTYRCQCSGGTPLQNADLYSVLRSFGSPPCTPDALLASIKENPVLGFTAAHRDMLQQTERAHAHPLLLRYRAHRLDLLGWKQGSDCTRMLIPDLQNIVLEYLSGALVQYLSEEELLAEAVMAEVEAAEDWARAEGRNVRQRRE